MRESIIGLTDVRQAAVVEQNLLENKSRDSLRQLRSALHDPQAQRNNFRREQERDDFLLVGLHQRSDDSETCETQVLERTSLGRCVEERVEEQRNVRLEEAAACFWM